MITYNWTYRCDYCEVEVVGTTKLRYYPDELVVRPTTVPALAEHGRWRNVDGLLVCPKHRVSVDE